jgi:two-component system response regulator
MKPKVILLDMKLPEVDGVEILWQIKGDPGLLTVPVVMLTSSNQDGISRRVIASV